jgi:signal transduction histidine kinase
LLIAVDVLASVVLLGIVGYAALDASTPHTIVEPRWVSYLTALVVAGPVAVRRIAPLPALAGCLGGELAAMLSGVIPVVAMGAPLSAVTVVLYTVSSVAPRRRSVPALAACLGGITAAVLASRLVTAEAQAWSDTFFGLTFGCLMLTAGWMLGLTTGARREFAERTAAQRARQAVGEERLRIARELHDVVAHSMSLIAVQAGIGNHVAEQRPAAAREALRVIEATSRSSLTEMRHLLGVLRSETDGPALAPAPGPAGIPALVEHTRSAGVTVTTSLDDLTGLPDGVGLSVYRIVQEALTNVVRHAVPARCAVTIAVTSQTVRVEVTNDGRHTEPGPGGHGLIGMRERVAVYGGTFEAGPRPGGGWHVDAVLPLGSAS